jgi:TatD DNase family protein
VKPTRAADGRRSGGYPPAPEPLPRPAIDSHCHLDIHDGDEWLEVADAIDAAAAVGVTRIVQVGCDPAGARWAVEAAERHPALVAAVGLHPNEAPRLAAAGRLADELAGIETLLDHPRVRAVGETGLDRFRTGDAGWEVQEESFRAHIRMAREHDLALVIHDRDAHSEVLAVLADEPLPERVVFHCFSGDAAMAATCAERGWVVSFAGVLTFKNADALRQAAAVVPLSQTMVETDAPYLTPAPHRGRPNASYLIPHTVAALARIHGVATAEVCDAVTATALGVFGDW